MKTHLRPLAVVLMAAACGEHPTAPAQNAAPRVTVNFIGASACTPVPAKLTVAAAKATPCTVMVIAQATDPDRDALSYAWSGCASGASASATCTVTQPGTVDAVVTVSDNHGHSTTASAAASGSNQPPDVQIGYIRPIPTAPDVFDLLGNVIDPDEGFLCGAEYCVSAAASGACGPRAFLSCDCLGGLETEVRRTATSGLCTVTFTLKDSWGQLGTPSVTFDVANGR
jgi:Bacterial Ig domain